MPAIELRQDEIGQYDPAAAKARRERLWGKPKVNLAIVRPSPRPEEPARIRLAATCYSRPIGPPKPSLWSGSFASIRDEELLNAGVTRAQFEGDQRSKHLAGVRRVIWYRAATETSLSLPAIGRLSGGKDHTSVYTAIERYKELVLGIPSPRCTALRERARERHFRMKAERAAMKTAAE